MRTDIPYEGIPVQYAARGVGPESLPNELPSTLPQQKEKPAPALKLAKNQTQPRTQNPNLNKNTKRNPEPAIKINILKHCCPK
mgnify:CR=1 FL=1